MSHLTHVFGDSCEAVYIDGRLCLAAEVIPAGVVFKHLLDMRITVNTLELHDEVTVNDPEQFPDDAASLVTMLKEKT